MHSFTRDCLSVISRIGDQMNPDAYVSFCLNDRLLKKKKKKTHTRIVGSINEARQVWCLKLNMLLGKFNPLRISFKWWNP